MKEYMDGHRSLKLLFCMIYSILLVVALVWTASAQTAIEYGIIGSKPPPKSPDSGTTISKKIQAGLKQTPSSDQGYKRTIKGQTKTGGRTGGPLIIERRGDHYERIN